MCHDAAGGDSKASRRKPCKCLAVQGAAVKALIDRAEMGRPVQLAEMVEMTSVGINRAKPIACEELIVVENRLVPGWCA